MPCSSTACARTRWALVLGSVEELAARRWRCSATRFWLVLVSVRNSFSPVCALSLLMQILRRETARYGECLLV